MRRLRDLTSALVDLPHYLVPNHGSNRNCNGLCCQWAMPGTSFQFLFVNKWLSEKLTYIPPHGFVEIMISHCVLLYIFHKPKQVFRIRGLNTTRNSPIIFFPTYPPNIFSVYVVPHMHLGGVIFWACLLPADVFGMYFSKKIPAKVKSSSTTFAVALRPAILDLADKIESAGGWASERVFSKWVYKHEWRRCLPPIFEFVVGRETCLRNSFYSEVPKAEISKLTNLGS